MFIDNVNTSHLWDRNWCLAVVVARVTWQSWGVLIGLRLGDEQLGCLPTAADSFMHQRHWQWRGVV